MTTSEVRDISLKINTILALDTAKTGAMEILSAFDKGKYKDIAKAYTFTILKSLEDMYKISPSGASIVSQIVVPRELLYKIKKCTCGANEIDCGTEEEILQDSKVLQVAVNYEFENMFDFNLTDKERYAPSGIRFVVNYID